MLAPSFAKYEINRTKWGFQHAVSAQKKIFLELIAKGRKTKFGEEHRFEHIKNHQDYKLEVPVRDYEGIKNYIEEIKSGKENILWPGIPVYFAKTSGTTSGVKFIPITRDSISNHIFTARLALLQYIYYTGKPAFTDGKLIFLSGSPELETKGEIKTGRLSGIVNHHIPAYLRTNQLPSYRTNSIEDWPRKLDQIVEETITQDMRLISGIPPWLQMYFDSLTEKTGKKIKDVFPNFQLLVHGGVNFAPYKDKLLASIGGEVDLLETYPASEGFIAFQDYNADEGLLLNTDAGIFYEFIPATEIFDSHPTRLSLEEIKTGENYAIILSTNAGLWAYNLGDTIKFLSVDPYRIVVTGRIKQFISAFGEHVIAEEVETAIQEAAAESHALIREFTVAPKMKIDTELPAHEWFIEFDRSPYDRSLFASRLNMIMQKKNIYYADLQKGKILQPLIIHTLKPGSFHAYMNSIGKLGGQNKVPHLSNDRNIVEYFINNAMTENGIA